MVIIMSDQSALYGIEIYVIKFSLLHTDRFALTS